MNDWNGYGYCSYPAEVFPRPVRRVIRFVILFNLSALCLGAVLFGIYGGIEVVREVTANPHAYQTTSPKHPIHANHSKGRHP